MNITMKELKRIGFDPLIASRMMNEICRLVPYSMESFFEEVIIKGQKTTQYQKLRSVELKNALWVCDYKLAHPRAKTAIDTWKKIKTALEEFSR